LAQNFYVPKLSIIRKTVCERYNLCARNNPRYLLLFVYIFSGWIKVSLTQTEKAQKVSRSQKKEMIPQFRKPVSIESDNGLDFVTEVVQLMTKRLKIT
jgi:hypothetical protein